MARINLLDCTLRDGGYINNWNFGERNIREIIVKLAQSNIEIIECGFLQKNNITNDNTLFENVNSIKKYLPNNIYKDTMFVGMIAMPYIPIEHIEDCTGESITGIRVTFHENEVDEALEYSKELMNKGYKIFIQPVGTTSYSDTKLLDLVSKVNEINPYAFYLVDTLGVMYRNDLLRMFHLLDHNLNESIQIGFHSHNNLQLSFANTQELLLVQTKRTLIIDSSVFGMGRGAGNLCTELISHYINENIEYKYDLIPILEIYDEYLSKISFEGRWGYSIPYYLAAINNCHPNYSTFLLDKDTLNVRSINELLHELPLEKRDIYDKKLIEKIYLNYQQKNIDDSNVFLLLKKIIPKEVPVLILGPGESIKTQKTSINNFIMNNDVFIISTNFIPEDIKIDSVFVSNAKKYEKMYELQANDSLPIILTSNLKAIEKENFYIINYGTSLIPDDLLMDNAGLMLMSLLKKLDIDKVILAGFDGYNTLLKEGTELESCLENNFSLKKNENMKRNLQNLKNNMNIEFLTLSMYE